jgi:hypothetical protein
MTKLTAYMLSADMTLEPAQRWRSWMDETDQRFANRCLPLLMANQSGWTLALNESVDATWTGENDPAAVRVRSDSYLAPTGHFGYGILTWPVACLFRTEPGWSLLGRGPSNLWRDGCAPLEGLVETDWTPATFTMNWRFTRPCSTRWEAGEPYCMILPQRRGDLEAVEPRLANHSDEDLLLQHTEWAESRATFLHELDSGQGDARSRGWQRDYFAGRTIRAERAAEHQTVRRLRKFARGEDV